MYIVNVPSVLDQTWQDCCETGQKDEATGVAGWPER